MVWQRREGRVRTVETPGTFLGAFPETRYHTAQMWLEPGDRVVLFSDGLTETRAPNGEFFGRDRLEALVIEGADASVTQLGETIIAALQGFRDAPAPRDDVAILIAELGPARSDLSS